jgi:hypothetical protein
MVEWRRSLDQRGRVGVRIPHQWRNNWRDEKPRRDARRSQVRSRCRPHFPDPIYLGAKRALRGRAMGRVVRSNAVVNHQAYNRLRNLYRGGGFRGFGAPDRIPSTQRGTHPRRQRVYHQQPSFEHYD